MRTDRLGNVAEGVDLKIKSGMARYTMIVSLTAEKIGRGFVVKSI